MSRDYSTPLKAILSAAAGALIAEGRPPNRVELTPGNLPAWDDCCEGQLYLRVVEIYPTAGSGSPFPQIDTQQRGASNKCALHLVAVHIALGIIRCAHTVDEQGVSPTSAEVTGDADLMLLDMATLLDALICTGQDIPGIMSLKIDKWVPLGVSGGCAGGEWSAYLAMDPCLCSPVV